METPETFRELPKIKAISLIDAINDAETPLKDFPVQERLRIRQSVVREKVDTLTLHITATQVIGNVSIRMESHAHGRVWRSVRPNYPAQNTK